MYSSEELNKWCRVSSQLVQTAGQLIKDAFRKEKNIQLKTSNTDLVTETDKAVEEFLITGLRRVFPDHLFIGEESLAEGAKRKLTDSPTWIIDPIDGTMNFVHTYSFIAISIGLYVRKEGVVGIVYNPILDQMYMAKKGEGAFLNGEKISVSGQTELSKSLVHFEMSCQKPDVLFRNLMRIKPIAHGMRSTGSAALNMCLVASGGAEAYYEMGIWPWDTAAGSIIVKEAGGYVCDVDGGPFNVMGRRMLCTSSKELADQLVALLEIYEVE